MKEYFVLQVSEDGDVYLHEYTKEELLAEFDDLDKNEVADEIPNGDVMEFSKSIFIFKGKLVKPFEKTVVKEFDID